MANNHAPLPLAFAVVSAPLASSRGKTPPHPGAAAIWQLWQELCAGVTVELEEPSVLDVSPDRVAKLTFRFPPPMGSLTYSVAPDAPGVAAVRALLTSWRELMAQRAEAERLALEPAGKGTRTETSKD